MLTIIQGCYYGNLWESQKFPFLSQSLFNATSTSTNYTVYDQTLILKPDFTIDEDKFAAEGVPYLTGTYIAYLITSNAGLTATLVHMLLWNWDDLKGAWSWAHPRNLPNLLDPKSYVFWHQSETPEERLARKVNDPDLDPHYKLILRNKYREVPLWWWAAILIISWVVGIVCLYSVKVHMPPTQSHWNSTLTICSQRCRGGVTFLPCALPLSLLSSSVRKWASRDSNTTYSPSVRCWLATFSLDIHWPTSTSHALRTTLHSKRNSLQKT
jgi:hypothetical protein